MPRWHHSFTELTMKLHNYIRNHRFNHLLASPIMEYISNGYVKVNNKRRRTNRDIIPLRDKIEILLDNQWYKLEPEINRTEVLIYKQRGYLCTHSDTFNRPTIFDSLPQKFRTLRSAGRLDQDSEGLMILTDEGYYLFSLISPQFGCQKSYLVATDGVLSDAMITESLSGSFRIYRDSKEQILKPVKITKLGKDEIMEYSFLDLDNQPHWYRFVLLEGKYNQIRKMCATYGCTVNRLIRIQHSNHMLTPELYAKDYMILSEKKDE